MVARVFSFFADIVGNESILPKILHAESRHIRY